MTYIAPATKVLRYPETLAAMQCGARVNPLHVEMDLSGVCNLACGWCRFGDGRQGGVLMDDQLAYDTLDQMVDLGVRAVTFSGGGEPTMHPSFAALCEYAHQVGIKVGVYTNGVNRERLIAAAPWCEWIYVSLDAASAEDYQGAKGRDQFEQVCGTIVALSRCTRTLGVGFLLTDKNWGDCAAMRRLGLELGADYVQFRPVAGLADYRWVHGALDWLEKLPGAVFSRERFLQLAGLYERGYTICRAARIGPCIGAQGDVWACPNTRGLEHRKLGNVKEQPLADILWRAPEQVVDDTCEPTCRHHMMNKTLELVCARQPHEEFV